MMRRISWLAAVLVSSLCPMTAAVAQDAHGVQRAGRAGAGSILGGGVEAAAVQPALIGLDASWQVLLPVNASAQIGSGPVGLADIREAGDSWSAAEREAWLQAIGTGTFTLAGRAAVGSFGLQIGSIGVQLEHHGRTDVALGAGTAEALLFGNTGRTGSARTLDLSGNSGSAAAWSTLRIAHGRTVARRGDRVVRAGVALEYRQVHGLLDLPATNGVLAADPINANVTFQARYVSPDGGTSVASQMRLTPSVAVLTPQWRAGVTVEGALAQRGTIGGTVERGRATIRLDETTREADTEEIAGDPADVAALEELLGAGRRVRLSGAYRVHPAVWVTTDLATAMQDIGTRGRSGAFAAVGVDATPTGWVRVRGGLMQQEGTMGWSAGGTFLLGPVGLDLAYGRSSDAERLAVGLRLQGGRGAGIF